MPLDPLPEFGRIKALDLLRFIAAMLVVIHHYAWRASGLLDLHGSPLESVGRYGYLGVQLFFMISGFVILMSAENRSPRAFAFSRMARLYPAFWVCCTITFVVLGLLASPERQRGIAQYFANLTMVPKLLGFAYVDIVYWSLLEEIKFYAIVALLIATGFLRRVELFLGIWVVLAAASLGYRYLDFLLLSKYAPYFAAGGVSFLIMRRGGSPWRWLLLGACLVCAFRVEHRQILMLEQYDQVRYSAFVADCIVLTYFLVFAFLAIGKLNLPWRALAYAGALTYPLYLLHFEIGMTLFSIWTAPTVPPLIKFSAVTLLVLGLAAIVSFGIERRACPLLKRWLEQSWARVVVARRPV